MKLKMHLISVIPIVSALFLPIVLANGDQTLVSTLTDDNIAGHNITKRSQDNVKLVCYYSNWAVYRPGLAKFTPQNINPFLCTHLIYAFAGLSSKFEMKAFDPYNDINQGNYKKFTGLKKYNNQLKTMIAIGGWNEGSKRFSKLVASSELRFGFIKSAMKFLRDHDFDGLDFDWEYPGFREGSSPDDKEGYAKLIREIRYAFNNEKLSAGKERLLVSVAVPAGQDYIDQGFDVGTISQFADFLNVLSYDYHTSFDPETDHHAPLKSKPGNLDVENGKLNTEWTINYFIKLGASRDKIILGIPTYGRSFTLADSANNGINALAEGPGEPGPSTREKGYLAFYEICQKVEDEDWQLHRPYPHIEGPFAVKDKQWVAFDDIEIIQDKARFIIDHGLGGAMIWTLDNDDFRGTCYGEQNPLISSLRSALINISPLVQSSPSERTNSRLSKPKPNSELAEAGLNALSVNTRRNQRRRQFYATTTTTSTTTTTTTTPAPTTSKELLSRTTPEPPTTPDPGSAFNCEDEGFFTNKKDCRKYFWCLDSGPANLGIVAHSFTCPSGLFFNSKTEACDYPGNVSCKLKKESTTPTTRKPMSKPKIATTSAPTTPKPTTTTQLPITGPPVSDDKMLVDTMFKLNNAQLNGNNDEVIQLANLIKSLGGFEKVQSLLKTNISNKSENLSSLSHQNRNSPQAPTTLNFFAPNYVTPKRQVESATQPPLFNSESNLVTEASQNSFKPVRQRRPQYDYDLVTSTPPTTASLFSYYEKPKSSQNQAQTDFSNSNRNTNDDRNTLEMKNSNANSDHFVRKSDIKPFEFNYNNPERNTLMGAFNDLNLRRGGNEMNLYPNTSVVHSSPAESQTNTRQVYKIPIRISSGNLVKIPTEAIENNARRPQSSRRVRVQSAFAVASGKPGVVYEDEFFVDSLKPVPNQIFQPEPFMPPSYVPPSELSNVGQSMPVHHQFGPPSFQFDSKPNTKPTQRRRPQNHFNIPLEETPISLLINTPPRSANHNPNDFRLQQSTPMTSIRPTTTPAPTTQYSPPTAKVTNYNTLPPEFDISPFTSSNFANSVNANNYQKSSSALNRMNPFETTTPMPRHSEEPSLHRQAGRRRIARPRRPIPQIQDQPQPRPTRPINIMPQTTTTTTTTTTRKPQKVEYSEPVLDSFNGPSVFAGKEGGLGCSKRGVFAHPESCGMFVVCAPVGRGKKGLRTLTHHCPAEQVFVQEVGRCRPGNKDRCEVF